MSQPKLLSKPWATDGLKNDIPTLRGTGLAQEAATYTEGFPSITMTPISVGGKPPSGKDMNGILYELSAHIVYTNKGQRYCFDQTFCTSIGGYPKGSVLMNDAGTAEYISLIDRNTANFNLPTVNIAGKWAIYAGEGTIPPATTAKHGLAQLSSATNSDAENLAATPKAVKAVFDALTNLDGRSFKQYGALSSRNLNDLKGDANYGVWHQNANAAATPERNYPTLKAGTLYVLPSAYQNQQIYYPLDQNVFYKRHSLPDGNWGAWHTMCEVIDSHSSTSTTAAASANQVKRLNDRAANIEQTKLGNSGNQTINGQLNIARNAWEKIRFTNADGSFWRFESAPVSESENGARFNYVFTGANGLEVGSVTFPRVAGGETVAYQTWVNSKIKFSRPVVKGSNVAINLDLTNRAQIITELGNDYLSNGVNQLIIHNYGTQHNVTNLPLPNKSPIQLDICLMGSYSYIDCHYITLNRSFRTPVNWHNETLTLNWKENLTQDNGVMLTGNQTIDGYKIFMGLVEIRNELAVGNRTQESNAHIDFYAKGANSGDYTARIINPIGTQNLNIHAAGGVKIASTLQATAPASDANNDQVPTTAWVRGYAPSKSDLNNAAPSGEIAFFARNSAPTGWLKANGAAVSRTTYAALFAAIGTTFGAGDGSTTFNLPDLRGEFVRCWDDGRGVDAGRAFGTQQADELKAHKHTLTNEYGTVVSRFVAHTDENPEGVDAQNVINAPANRAHTYLSINNTGGNETRPRNIALLACIKI